MPVSRRAFLKTSAVIAGAFWVRPASSLAIASTLPIGQPHDFHSDPDILLEQEWERYDLLLLPAYAAAGMIARGDAAALPGPAGRAHDPDGAFTIPARFTLTTLVYASAPPVSPRLDHILTAGLLPDFMRLSLGALLLSLGSSPNETDPARLHRVLWALRNVAIAADPLAALRSGRGQVALTQMAAPWPAGVASPPAAILIVYDWVLPLAARRPLAARDFLSSVHTRVPGRPALPAGVKAFSLAPLPPVTLARCSAIWKARRPSAV
jgi:hypothetical protein